MDALGWINVIKQLPPEIHDGLSLVMGNGLELIVQAFMRLDEQHVMIRGRVSGSTDAGRILFIPYNNINVMIFNRFLKDPEVYGWFGDAPTAGDVRRVGDPVPAAAEGEPEVAMEEAPAAAAAPQPQKPGAAVPPPPRQPVPQPMPAMGGNMSMPAKAAMIERLRKRAQGGGPPEQK